MSYLPMEIKPCKQYNIFSICFIVFLQAFVFKHIWSLINYSYISKISLSLSLLRVSSHIPCGMYVYGTVLIIETFMLQPVNDNTSPDYQLN